MVPRSRVAIWLPVSKSKVLALCFVCTFCVQHCRHSTTPGMPTILKNHIFANLSCWHKASSQSCNRSSWPAPRLPSLMPWLLQASVEDLPVRKDYILTSLVTALRMLNYLVTKCQNERKVIKLHWRSNELCWSYYVLVVSCTVCVTSGDNCDKNCLLGDYLVNGTWLWTAVAIIWCHLDEFSSAGNLVPRIYLVPWCSRDAEIAEYIPSFLHRDAKCFKSTAKYVHR